MPLFSWMKWTHEKRVQAQDEAPLKTSRVLPSHMLIRELLWHVEEREQLARETVGLHWFQKYPRLRTFIPTSELHQLELLCAQIPPSHAATVLSRFREVLATNNISPWELASVFKQVLRDLSQKEYDEEHNLSVQPAQLRPMEAWTSRYIMKQGFVTPPVANCGDQPREEIPTISGYVDRAMRHSGSLAGSNRNWDLPYYYPVSLRPIGTYSTTL
ncbi:LOW QUALITY PROTEIN: protein RD3-like [Etheostoma spectabile]|nr:LOW QUALITY PROTEIN: protein RD3-like [Etheostoma spectabile]